MVEESQVFDQMARWSSRLKIPIHELTLDRLFEDRFIAVCSKRRILYDTNLLRANAFDQALIDNATRIEAELIKTCDGTFKQLTSESRLPELQRGSLATCLNDMAVMKQSCQSAATKILDTYLPQDSPTRDLFDIPAVCTSLETALLDHYRTKELPCFIDLDAILDIELKYSEQSLQTYIAKNSDVLLLDVEDIVQSVHEQMSARIFTELSRSYGELQPIITNPLQIKIQESCHQLFLEQLLPVFKKMCREALSQSQFVVRDMQPFDPKICSQSSRNIIAAMLFHFGHSPQEEIVGDIFRALDVYEPFQIDLESTLGYFRTTVTLPEKCCIMLSLCLFLSEVYRSLPSLDRKSDLKIHYRAEMRQLYRNMVNKLFRRGVSNSLFNDWLLARSVEELVAEMQMSLVPGAAPPFLTGKINICGCHNPSKEEIAVKLFEIEALIAPTALHTTIALSGWGSSKDDMKKEWNHLVNYPNQTRVLSIRWDSGTRKTIFKRFAVHIAILLHSPVAGVLLFLKANPFKVAGLRADATGELLATCIRNQVFGTGTISLVGFSLGARVVFKCLETLASDEQVYVHDVIFLGGAVSATAADSLWTGIRRVVAGRLINVFSVKDKMLSVGYRLAKLSKPIGNCGIEAEGLVENLDVSDYVLNHQDHKKFLNRTLSLLNYQP